MHLPFTGILFPLHERHVVALEHVRQSELHCSHLLVTEFKYWSELQFWFGWLDYLTQVLAWVKLKIYPLEHSIQVVGELLHVLHEESHWAHSFLIE